ncbi:hypothetical protein BCR43DRAFT_484897 [Syncephalastrum racemosum]|uniref:Uncharacterized protein n=1 Tax=Syncephalastrum racemosum TaxID=13706 RepID=A0A1X2HLL4_SYNRA|nr:hypothetical protein BCR43DRAFT_484897 [Syncephalastrum racemosum]
MWSGLSGASWSDIFDPSATDDELSRLQSSRHHGSDSEWVNINSMPQDERKYRSGRDHDRKDHKVDRQSDEEKHAQPSNTRDTDLMSSSSHHEKHKDDASSSDHHDKQSPSHDKHQDESHDKHKDGASHDKHKEGSSHDKHEESSHDKHEDKSSHDRHKDGSSHDKHKEESRHDIHEKPSSDPHSGSKQKDAKHEESKAQEHPLDGSHQDDIVLLDRPRKDDLSSSTPSIESLSDGASSSMSTPELIDPTTALEPHQETNGPADALPAAWSDYMRLMSSSSANIMEPTVVVSTVYAVNTLPGTYPNIDYNALDYGNIGQIGVFTDAGARTSLIDPSAFVASLVLSLLFGYVFGRE